MKRIAISFLLTILLVSSARMGSLSVGEVYDFKIEKDIKLVREFYNDTSLNYEKNTHFELFKKVTIDEYDTQNKVISYTSKSVGFQYAISEHRTLDLGNNSFNLFFIPTLLVSSLNSANYLFEIIFYESLDLPVNPYPLIIFDTEVINQALLCFQTLEVEIPTYSQPVPMNSSTLSNLLGNASSYSFMGAPSIEEGLKVVNNDTHSWDFNINLINFQIYHEVLVEFWKYNHYTSGITVSYTDDMVLSVLESRIEYEAEGIDYMETKSIVYKVTLVDEWSKGLQDLIQMPVLSLFLMLILIILIIKKRNKL